MIHRGGHDAALDLLEHVAGTADDLLKRSPKLAVTACIAYMNRGDHEQVLAIAEGQGAELLRNPSLTEKYVRSLLELEQHETLIAYMQTRGLTTVSTTGNLAKAIGICCEGIGWWLYGQGRYEDGISFLQAHATNELGARGRENMNLLMHELHRMHAGVPAAKAD